jgi:hypothetical protein
VADAVAVVGGSVGMDLSRETIAGMRQKQASMRLKILEDKTMVSFKGNAVEGLRWLPNVAVFMILVIAGIMFNACSEAENKNGQKSFASPAEAVTALINAVKQDDTQELLAITGPEGEEIVSSGDDVADKADRARFVEAYEAMNRLDQEGPEIAILIVGEDEWPFPIPVVKAGEGWHFDVEAGKEELLNRRIGRNELNVIKVMNAYVDAQREYAGEDRDGDGVREFAQKFPSDEGKQDGLYWPVKEGEEMSPMGPFVAQAIKEGYRKEDEGPTAYHGYYYKILKAQGASAPGGAYDYVVKDNMILGFGLVANPAEYGASGIMTCIINQQGIVYEKDLGEETETIVEGMEAYDPDETWKKVADVFLPSQQE